MTEEHNRRKRDQALQSRARQLRREPTEPEIRLWRHLSRSQLGNFKFRRQAALEPFIADFFCPALGLIVEIDGHTHVAERDSQRDAYLKRHGLHTFRVTNTDVMSNMEGVLTALLAYASTLPSRSNWRLPDLATPHPNPSPEGEGLANADDAF